ncbi:dual oxidase maturation factor 1-like isoform X1 [Clavelina lepadiformis]|uniref:dual oxidase maturation factor 1-like isoform X1 n=1 Tax=Clavelina lepadiformis TaxID=159417 RepID=UPI004042CC78
MSGIYSAFRQNGGPTQHPAMPTAVTADVLEIGFVFAFAILAFCFALIVPGYRGIARFYFVCRVVVSLFIGSAIFLGVLGQEWEYHEIETRTYYKAFTPTEIHAKVGVKIGLGSVNITLLGTPVNQTVGHVGNQTFYETINYNERFHWAWRQGRIGFGPYAGIINREYRAAQFRGAPLPILWVAEYFTLDGELIRWGRSYRTAGWFTNMVLWTAVPTWLIANILSAVVLFYAGWMFLITGGLMLVGNIIWASIKWGSQPLVIPFEDGHIEPHYGPSFYLVLAGGIISCLWGIMIVCADLWWPQFIADFFDNDVLKDYDQYYHKDDEEDDEQDVEKRPSSHHRGGVQKRASQGLADIRAKNWTRRRKSRDLLVQDLNREKYAKIYDNYSKFAVEKESSIATVSEEGSSSKAPPKKEEPKSTVVELETLHEESSNSSTSSSSPTSSRKPSHDTESLKEDKISDVSSQHGEESLKNEDIGVKSEESEKGKEQKVEIPAVTKQPLQAAVSSPVQDTKL